ncbi:MAG TPA: NADP-dependent oxidoreductase [Acidimicrobiales bacterium]|nr:NADP-dependent oxidoreductase [Acidimicrobiales bacterium]
MPNRQIVLRQRPTGRVDASTTDIEEVEIPEPAEGEALVRVGTVSIDPTIRTWMNDAPGYLPPIEVGAVIRSGGAGVVTQSRTDRFAVGDVVYGMTGWREWAVTDRSFTVVPRGLGLSLPSVMNVLGLTGVTAYFGLIDVGRVTEGDVVVVSGAAGATGSVAGQLARAKGAGKVVGVAGGPEKCRYVVERLGFDECLDYREPHLTARLHQACPKGIDLYFDNVGGEILDAALACLALRGRVVVCGAISQYNAAERHGLRNTSMLVIRRARMEGFLVMDYAARYPEAQAELAGLVLSGAIVHDEHVVEGLENAPSALNMLFDGANTGKTLVVVDPSVTLD